MLEKHKLYNGKILILFDRIKHKFYREDMTLIKDSVTGATKKIDKSAPLMGWVAKLMAQFLMDNWDLKKIKTEAQKMEMIMAAKFRYREAQKEAADIGTEIHKWIEKWIKYKKPPEIPDDEKVRNGVMAFLKWVKVTDIEFKESEKVIYSKKHNYAGILDAEALIDGKLCIVDFKSSKGIYDEMKYQVAGYWNAREEETGKNYKRGYIIQFDKETGEFDPKKNISEIIRSEYLKDLKAFLGALAIKRRENELQWKPKSPKGN